MLVGRRPETSAAAEGASPFAIDDPKKSVSRVHAGLAVVGGALVVTDRGSGNGTRVRRGELEIDCPVGQPVAVLPGDVLEFGSVTATVAAAR